MLELKHSVVDKAEGENYYNNYNINNNGLFRVAAKAGLIRAKGQHAA